MSQQLTISSAFSALALAFLCVIATAKSDWAGGTSASEGWVQADQLASLPR